MKTFELLTRYSITMNRFRTWECSSYDVFQCWLFKPLKAVSAHATSFPFIPMRFIQKRGLLKDHGQYFQQVLVQEGGCGENFALKSKKIPNTFQRISFSRTLTQDILHQRSRNMGAVNFTRISFFETCAQGLLSECTCKWKAVFFKLGSPDVVTITTPLLSWLVA